jgi:hypothetical protein
MRRRRVLFVACLTAGTLAGVVAAVHATASGLCQTMADLSEDNLRDALILGSLGGQVLGLMMSGLLITIGDTQGRTIHAMKGGASAGAFAAILIWFPLWVFVKMVASG